MDDVKKKCVQGGGGAIILKILRKYFMDGPETQVMNPVYISITASIVISTLLINVNKLQSI